MNKKPFHLDDFFDTEKNEWQDIAIACDSMQKLEIVYNCFKQQSLTFNCFKYWGYDKMTTIFEAWNMEKEETVVTIPRGYIFTSSYVKEREYKVINFNDFDWSNKKESHDKPFFDINKYKGLYVMNCATKEEAQIFCAYLNTLNRTWATTSRYNSDLTNWEVHEDQTIYYFNEGLFGSIKNMRAEGDYYDILHFSDFKWIQPIIKENLVKAKFHNYINKIDNAELLDIIIKSGLYHTLVEENMGR